MTTNRSSKAKIQIRSRKGKIVPVVRHPVFQADGWVAMIFIFIILASRLVRALAVKVIWPLACFVVRITWPLIKIAAIWVYQTWYKIGS